MAELNSDLHLLPVEDWTISVDKDGACVVVGAWVDDKNHIRHKVFDRAVYTSQDYYNTQKTTLYFLRGKNHEIRLS